jgi:hypothetical protein
VKKNLKITLLFVSLLCVTTSYQNCGKVAFSSSPTQANGTNNPNGSGTGGGGGDNGPNQGNTTCVYTSANTPIITTLPAGVTAATVQATCPSVGQDTECGVVVIIADSGNSIYFTGQGPYDGVDDTLVGVINISSNPVSTLALSSTLDIMGFDGDGPDTYRINGTKMQVPGNAIDDTTYGGPDSYYTNVTPDNTAGTVNFITPIATGGGSTYFGLENALTSTSSCLITTTN